MLDAEVTIEDGAARDRAFEETAALTLPEFVEEVTAIDLEDEEVVIVEPVELDEEVDLILLPLERFVGTLSTADSPVFDTVELVGFQDCFSVADDEAVRMQTATGPAPQLIWIDAIYLNLKTILNSLTWFNFDSEDDDDDDEGGCIQGPEDGAAMVVEEDEDGIEGAVTKDWRELSCLDRFANLQISEDDEWTDSVGPEEDRLLGIPNSGGNSMSSKNPSLISSSASVNGEDERSDMRLGLLRGNRPKDDRIEERFLSSAGSSSSKKSKSEPVRMTRLFGLLMKDDEEEQQQEGKWFFLEEPGEFLMMSDLVVDEELGAASAI
ncbi:hypothetical protein BY996DRAFT_6560486 [Phakopsora pachyrhizi]|nr:hypothetical protein BY996DRAFT_6560486 [Phakopsora pachyrhizi]